METGLLTVPVPTGARSPSDHHDRDDGRHDFIITTTDYNLQRRLQLADALTSVLAIAGLVIGRLVRLVWLDAMIGIVGAGGHCALVMEADARRRRGPARCRPPQALIDDMRRRWNTGGDRVADLHVWRVGPRANAAIVAIVADSLQAPEVYKRRLSGLRHSRM